MSGPNYIVLGGVPVQVTNAVVVPANPFQIQVQNYGTAGNANYQNPSNLKWYVDSGYLTEATDDSAALASAFSAATSAVNIGETVEVILSGNHYIKTPQVSAYGTLLVQFAFFIVPSNCTITGNGAWLRVGPGLNALGAPNPQGYAILANTNPVSNVTIRGVNFDCNGQSGSPVGQENDCICFQGGTNYNVTIEDCTFYNHSGLTTVFITGSQGTLGKNLTVRNCRFLEIGNNASLVDHVALYLQGEGVVIADNVFFNDPATNFISRNFGQAIQVQGIGVTCTGNSFTNHANAFLTGSAWNSPACNSQNVTFSGNTVTACTVGVQFFQAIGTTLSDIAIVGNSFSISNDQIGQGEAALSFTDTNGANSPGVNRVTFVGNTCSYVHDSRWSDIGPAGLLVSGVMSNVLVAGNIFENWPQGAVVYTPASAFNPNAPSGTTSAASMSMLDWTISGNTIKNCGAVRGTVVLMQNDTSSSLTQRVHVFDNIISSTSSAIAKGVDVSAAGDTVCIHDNVYQNITLTERITSANGVTNTLIGGLVGDNGATTLIGTNPSHSITFNGLPQLANGHWLYGLSTSPPTTYILIGLDTNNATRIAADGDTLVAIGAPATFSGAGAGDLVMAENSSLRFSSPGSTHVACTYDGATLKFAPVDPSVFGASGSNIAFYGGSPVGQQSRAGQLTAGAGSSGSGTVDVGSAFSQSTLNNNFATLVARLNAVEAIIHNLGLSL